ncbi:SpoIIE family protein phosphatase [Pontiella sulfatireligans]|uniref:Phosphoserine phosphatase RsbP n=1 Tax=Pontiella sulfatireligans TaxID=2750658 RepID=A0A6C2UPE0_9BACT|nr:SpoIIE family protein phosphatase [Pontiella sulfatireligans]VGO21184.1 Phosphoserine phosphatase RsbP [Pontiella sulfatireligans]
MIPGNSELLRQLMDNMTDNIFFKDLKSRFIMINKACARWNGFDNPQDAVGKSDCDLFTEEFVQAAHDDEVHIYETGEPLECKEEHAEWEDGHMKWVSTTKIPLRDADGRVAGCIGIGRDITDLKKKEAELEAATDELRRTNDRLRQANEQISEDLQMAARLQQTFLPQNYPVFLSPENKPLIDFHYYYEADSEIGGDYCAVHKLDDHRAGLLICDAMGHGVRAALITGIIRALADNLARDPRSAGDFLTSLNHQLHPMLQSKDAFLFVTACCLIIDVRTSELTGALAGHPAPFLLQPRQEKAALLPVEEAAIGPALAITDDFQYETFSIQLNPGDQILMYTDGICEAADESGEEFGTILLQQILLENSSLPLKELFPRMIKAAQNHTHHKKLGDDVCLLGFSLGGPA